MKIFHLFWLLLAFTAPLLAQQNYQYQYPYDPYNSSPKPQPNANAAPMGGDPSATGDYAYDKLLSYGFLEARYAFNDFKGDNQLSGASGIDVGLNVALFKPLYLHFGVDWLSGKDNTVGDFSMTGISAGAGIYLPICSRFHIFGEAGLRYDASSGVLDALNNDSFQVYIKPGVRVAATDKLELDASVYFATSDNLDRRSLQIDSYYALLSALDLNFGIDFGSDINSYHGGLRLRW